MNAAIPLLGGALAAAAGFIAALIYRARAIKAQATARDWRRSYEAAAEQARTAADGAREATALAETMRRRLEAAGSLKTDRIITLEETNARLVRVLQSVDPAAAALAVADPLDRVLANPPASRPADRGDRSLRSPPAAPGTDAAKDH